MWGGGGVGFAGSLVRGGRGHMPPRVTPCTPVVAQVPLVHPSLEGLSRGHLTYLNKGVGHCSRAPTHPMVW